MNAVCVHEDLFSSSKKNLKWLGVKENLQNFSEHTYYCPSTALMLTARLPATFWLFLATNSTSNSCFLELDSRSLSKIRVNFPFMNQYFIQKIPIRKGFMHIYKEISERYALSVICSQKYGLLQFCYYHNLLRGVIRIHYSRIFREILAEFVLFRPNFMRNTCLKTKT